MRQTDQYGNKIPQDLILLNTWPISELSEGEIKKIDNLDWYCFEGNKSAHIFVSLSELEKILGGLIDEENSPEDISIGKKWNLVLIDSVLHRWNETDGFYWA